MTHLKNPVFILFLVAVAAYPLLFPSNYTVGAGILVGVMAVATVGFILLVGYARQLAVGQPVFCTIGGYGNALLCTRLGMDPFLAMILSAGVAMTVAYLLGKPILKLRGYILAMASLSLHLMVGFIAIQAEPLTGGAGGIWGIPRFAIAGIPLANDMSFFYFVWVLVVIAVVIGLVIDGSGIGRSLKAIASSERASMSVGMDIARYKLQIFVLSAAMASITGSLTVHYLRIMAPEVFGFQYALSMITAVVAGGLNAVAGGVVGAMVVIGFREGLRATGLPELESIIMGALTVLVLITFPRGIVGAYELLVERFRPRRSTASGASGTAPAPSGTLALTAPEIAPPDAAAHQPILVVEDVKRAFGSLKAVDGVGFTVQPGSITSLIGSNGAGKTTMFDMISGLQTLNSGQISLTGHRIEALEPFQIARLGMARSFQNLELFENLTVAENVMAGTHRYTRAGLLPTILMLPSVTAKERLARAEAERWLDFVGMSAHRDRLPGTLSFGQQRLVEVARALALRPTLLLMDEPASGLNDTETEALADLLLRIRELGVTILLIEHDLRLVMGISSHLVVMNYGQKIAEGEPALVRKAPEVVAAYIGAR